MMTTPSNSEIIRFLTSVSIESGFIDTLKIRYRPIICPFKELLQYAKVESAFDVGCGSGQFCLLLATYSNVKRIMGIEIRDSLVRNAELLSARSAEGKEFKFKVFDGKVIPEEIADYKLVYMIDVFHHIPPGQQREFIGELNARMSKGSTLIFKDINKASPFVIFNKLHDLIFAGETGNEISFADAIMMLEATGFSIREKFTKQTLVYPHYFVVCEK
jgi:2-polyprenyl-3-methyl-5-hydroxy-6-metoxy-1,4-benzoquinol methylase